MAKLFISILALVMVLGMILVGCAAPSSSPTSAPTTTSPASGQPVRGGTLRVISSSSFPVVLGYAPQMGPADAIYTQMLNERLLRFSKDGWEPSIIESFDEDPTNKTITWHLRKGVTYNDGTSVDAESIKWNMQLLFDTNRMSDKPLFDHMEVIDPYTLKMYLKGYTSSVAFNYGFSLMFSPTAIEKNGKEWARLNPTSTGPFKLAEYQRDTLMKTIARTDYWQKGKPYLDAIEYRLIPDSVSAAALMQTRGADMWVNVPLNNALSLEKSGLKLNWGPGMSNFLLFNSSDPASKYANVKVREAIEYAIDRPTLTKLLTQSAGIPLTQLAIKGLPGYTDGFDPRPYDVNKAKQLLSEAGYPNGFSTELLVQDSQVMRDQGAAIQGYLAKVGITVKLDVADIARFSSSTLKLGWKELACGGVGINPDWLSGLLGAWGPNPFVFQNPSQYKSPEWLALCNKAMYTYNVTERKKVIETMVTQASKDVMVVPLYQLPQPTVLQPYVHSNAYTIHTGRWNSEDDWMEKH